MKLLEESNRFQVNNDLKLWNQLERTVFIKVRQN